MNRLLEILKKLDASRERSLLGNIDERNLAVKKIKRKKRKAQRHITIENPWKNKTGVVIFDIETYFDKTTLMDLKSSQLFKCGVVYSYDTKKFATFKNPKKLVKCLLKAKGIVSYNGERHDFLILKKYGLNLCYQPTDLWPEDYCFTPVNIESYDIFNHICQKINDKNPRIKFPSLNDLMIANWEVSKSKQSRTIDDTMAHCKTDVEYTKKLFDLDFWKIPIHGKPPVHN